MWRFFKNIMEVKQDWCCADLLKLGIETRLFIITLLFTFHVSEIFHNKKLKERKCNLETIICRTVGGNQLKCRCSGPNPILPHPTLCISWLGSRICILNKFLMQIQCLSKFQCLGRADGMYQEGKKDVWKKEGKSGIREGKVPWKPLHEISQFQNSKEDIGDPSLGQSISNWNVHRNHLGTLILHSRSGGAH